MSDYGDAAVAAARDCRNGATPDPVTAWISVMRDAFPESHWGQIKSCPKSTFLGLCEDGYIEGISPGHYTRSTENKRYAIAAARELFRQKGVPDDHDVWWRTATAPKTLKPNHQLEVIVALFKAKLLIDPKTEASTK